MASGTMIYNEETSLVSPTKGTSVGTFEVSLAKNHKVVNGSIIFAPTSAGSTTGFVVATGLPKTKTASQFPMVCIAGSDKGMTGRVRIDNDNNTVKIQTWYSNLAPKSDCTYLIPVNYITQ